ncbi:MAG TPA: HD domain-containing protein [Pirellulales bacterium]|jgi:HD superfamily phosphohydrolase|nr:HD domain-containing protein [Pirellulales bacterium]
MHPLRDIPEVAALDARRDLIRIPPELDIPLTPRVRRLIDTAEFRRLARVSQLGLVALVYPAANHTRFEHSLGVYRLALLYLRQLAYDDRFQAAVRPAEAIVFIAAALLHDLGHWPFCHPLEDIRLADVPRHEQFANRFILDSEVATVLREDWGVQPEEVVALLSERPRSLAHKILSSLLSGPIDIDKMDYLSRDSLHAGVPYGRNFDQQRLIGSLCLNAAGDDVAITDKGKTAAEMMVFARYVMFSEVYWHHGVRAATAMLQRAFYLLHDQLDLQALFRLSDGPLIAELERTAEGSPASDLLQGLFGANRRLYKRLAQYSFFQERALYERLARRPYPWLAACSEQFAAVVSTELTRRVAPHEILFDAPPIEREVEFNVEVFFPKESCYRRLDEVSPVVRTLAKEQFDDYVKRVRLFAHPRIAVEMNRLPNLGDLLNQAIDRLEGQRSA